MIWYFLMGMIAWAVGMMMLAKRWVENHVKFWEEVDLSEQTDIGQSGFHEELAGGEAGRREESPGGEKPD